MINLSKEDTRAETAGELAALPIIKSHAVETPGAELPSANNRIDQDSALRLAAETAGEFAQVEIAISYRQQLLSLSADDEENRIELVRLLAANNKSDDAIQNLAAIIGDRTATRKLRWQAVWLAPEIVGTKPERWTMLRERVRALATADNEMALAVEAQMLAATGQPDEGAKGVAGPAINDPNPHLLSLRALLEKKAAATRIH